MFPLFVSWWRLNFWWKHTWKVRERRGSGVKLWNIKNYQKQGAPVCSLPADGMDRQTKMYLYSLPSVLEAFHWYKSAWSALLCSPNSVPGRVMAWEAPGKCGASFCQVQPGAAVICPPSRCCRWRACLHTSAEGLPTVFHSRMNLHVTPCCGHCHLFGRFNCSLCLCSYRERSFGSGAIILWCVCKSFGCPVPVWDQGRALHFQACYCYPQQTNHFSHSVPWERCFPLSCMGAGFTTVLPVFSPDVILQFNPFDVMQL